jgi:hypothetical protein
MGDGIATTAAHIQLLRLATLGEHAQDLLDAVTLHREFAGNGGDQRGFMRT